MTGPMPMEGDTLNFRSYSPAGFSAIFDRTKMAAQAASEKKEKIKK